MTLGITHSTVVVVADDGTSPVGTDEWNAAHTLSGFGTGVAAALAINVGSAGAPVLFNGDLGTPSAGVATNLTGTAAGLTAGVASAVAVGGITGLGANVATFLATPSSANLISAVTDETGTGPLVFGTSPRFTAAITLGTESTTTGLLKLAHASSAFLTTIQAGNAAAARTYTWPTNFGAAGTVLTDAAGDGTLSWAAGGSGLTIGTTTITSGTTTRILYDNAGVVGEYTLTGTGTVVAMQAGPTFTGTAIFATGSVASPGLTFGGTQGVFGTTSSGTSNAVAFKAGGQEVSYFNAGELNLVGNGLIIWGNQVNTFTSSTQDTFIKRAAAATIHFGQADAAAPVAQTLQVQSVVAGTADGTAGKDWTLKLSSATGTGTAGNLIIKAPFSAKSSGTGQGTYVDRQVIVSKGKVLTDNTAVSLFEVALPTLAMCGGTIIACVECTDGTDMQSFSQTVTYSAVNKGAAYTTSITASTGDKSVSAGTIANTWSILTGTNKITIQLSSDTSLTPSSNAFTVYYEVHNHSEQATTIL